MSVLVADRVQQQEKLSALQDTFLRVKRVDEQEQTNRLLDTINAAKAALQGSYDRLQPIPQGLRELSWFTDVGQENMVALGELLDIAELHSYKMVQRYASFSRAFHRLGLNRALLRQYKEVADEMKEAVVDLKDRFFTLPQDNEFMNLMQQLNELA